MVHCFLRLCQKLSLWLCYIYFLVGIHLQTHLWGHSFLFQWVCLRVRVGLRGYYLWRGHRKVYPNQCKLMKPPLGVRMFPCMLVKRISMCVRVPITFSSICLRFSTSWPSDSIACFKVISQLPVWEGEEVYVWILPPAKELRSHEPW